MRLIPPYAGAAIALSLALSTPRAVPAQCITTPRSCTEFVGVGDGAGRLLVYRTRPLTTPNDTVVRALVVVHGAERAARWEFRNALAAAFLAGNVENALIVVPRFQTNDGSSCTDSLSANELNWNCDIVRGDWRVGGSALNDSSLSAFDAMDAILLRLADKRIFPNLRSIVVAGHSAGGQFVTLYQAVNRVHDRLGVATFYVVANASAYAYLDDRRALAVAGSESDAERPMTFARFADAQGCPSYAEWPFGLGKRPRYAARLTASQVREQAAGRPVTYLLAALDIAAPTGFFGSCAAMAQGKSRLARGRAFASYMTAFGRAPHQAIVVGGCGHDARCVYTSEDALPVLFRRTE
jgi:pimeloyl-ACP methyl ester carboxylesterase